MSQTAPNPLDGLRWGLPVRAARLAAQWGEPLPHNNALLDAREARAQRADLDLDDLRDALARTKTPAAAVVSNQSLLALADEVMRLRAVEDAQITSLELLAYDEAQRYDRTLQYPLRRIADDCYLPWSGSGDSPAEAGLLTREDTLARGWLPVHLDRADARAVEDGAVIYNRAGPGEVCLTREALIEVYTSSESAKTFRLTPDKIQPYTRGGGTDPATGEWDDHYVEWVPWAPDSMPDALPEGMRDRY